MYNKSTRVATSIKSLDPMLPTYSNPSRLKSALNRYAIQMYSYVSKEGAKSSAAFYLSYATELMDELLSCDSVRAAWMNIYGSENKIEVVRFQQMTEE